MNYKEKEKALREYRSCKLWEERLYINEVFSEETMEISKELSKQAKELRKKAKFVKVAYNRLVSFDVRQIPAEFKAGTEEQKA